MAALLAGVGEGDEVILPSYTFVSTANAFVIRGARPVFVDVRSDTLNLDERLLEHAITPRTKAIVVVHYAGVGCAMDEILALARRSGILVIEDAAQGVDARYDGRYLGTIGDIGTFSFHETKNFICGEGGALVLPTDRFSERAEILREKGTNRTRYFRGEIDKYTWLDVGSSYIPSDILAAFLFAQLENMDLISRRRSALYGAYRDALAPLAAAGHVVLPTVPPACTSNSHLFYVLVADRIVRSRLIEHLKSRGIHAVFHYVPLHTSPMGRKFGYSEGMLPVTETYSERLLRLPLYQELGEGDQIRVVRALFDFFGAREGRP
jgi:dTDP-4-amino-4,6-dideoxygalactose transaminase